MVLFSLNVDSSLLVELLSFDKKHDRCTMVLEMKMADRLTVEQRSLLMGRIRGKDTKPEMSVRRYLHAKGLRFRIHDRRLPGSPDIVLPKYRTVIFVNGCFWHGHEDCALYRRPKTHTGFWESKIQANRARDEKNTTLLRKLGWHVITLWECGLKTRETRETTLSALVNEIRSIDAP